MNLLEERIKGLRQRYARALPGYLAEIRELMVQASEVSRAALLRPFHTLAGTAGTFGCVEIASLAWEAEGILSSNSASNVSGEELEQLTSRLMDLEEALRRQPDSDDGSPDTVWSTFEGGGVV